MDGKPQFDEVKKGAPEPYVASVNVPNYSQYADPQAWGNGLCDCCDHGFLSAMDVFCCAECAISQTYNVAFNPPQPAPEEKTCCDGLHYPLCLGLICCETVGVLVPAYSIVSRTIFSVALYFIRRRLRERYNIHQVHNLQPRLPLEEEDRIMSKEITCCSEEVSDFLLSWCCAACVLCQMQQEVRERGEYMPYVVFPPEESHSNGPVVTNMV
ncbi:hypothetical protein AGDE_15238 [Angomonas deanei]|uniref:PLAC8 family, putative n=1 Tax=Angomonas deanei TaxID=59799 RepID=A0A7G2CEB3_9TRYP|nr:hypothetical protein AGDE_15238 [Angomonas deanei]CAD2217301.1 PLAC8 family, putative [Angomonas deanei]|eukprot:EPY19432.1 hypothetical protein AGDE_15238 [Angomonas deanei]